MGGHASPCRVDHRLLRRVGSRGCPVIITYLVLGGILSMIPVAMVGLWRAIRTK